MTAATATPAPAMLSREFRIDARHSIQFAYADGALKARWSPDVPDINAEVLRPAYTAARNAFLREVGRVTGLNILVVDL